jgi:hypothetical protein
MMAQPAASLDDIKETLSDHSDDVPEPEAKRQKIEEPTEAVANPEAEKKNAAKEMEPTLSDVIRAISWKEMADLREENARLRRAVEDMQIALARLTEVNKLNYESSFLITDGIQKIIHSSF